MSTQQIAVRLADLVGKGEFETAQKELFAQDAVSIEPQQSEQFSKETRGFGSDASAQYRFGAPGCAMTTSICSSASEQMEYPISRLTRNGALAALRPSARSSCNAKMAAG